MPARRLRFILGVPSAAVLAFAAVTSVAAHSQTVQPPPKSWPVVSGPISKAWAQAHCHAQSPAIVAVRSYGVVSFSPAGPLPCPPAANPGGQIHGD